MSLLNMHTWAPRDIRKLLVSYLDTMSRAMVLACHGLRWMWLIQNACKTYNSLWELDWMPDEMHIHPNVRTWCSNKSVRKHKYMITHASLHVLEWLQSEHAFVPSRDMVGYALACTPCRIDVAQWLCLQTNTKWDDVTIKNERMLMYVYRYDIADMLPFISAPIAFHPMFKLAGIAVIYGSIKILRALLNGMVAWDHYHMMCDYAIRHHGDDHEIYKIVRGMTRVEYIIETMCVV